MGYAKGGAYEWVYNVATSTNRCAATDVGGSAADIIAYTVPRDCYVVDFLAVVSVLFACDTTAGVVSLDKADADGSTNRTEIASITFVDADAVGDKRTGIRSGGEALEQFAYKLEAGEVLILEHKTACADAGTEDGGARIYALLAYCDTD